MSAIKANQVLNLDGDRIGSVVVDSIANMKNLNTEIEANATVELLGYYSKGDGGGGTFYWDSTSIEDDNGGTIIEATGIVDGRWIRNYSGSVNVKWFGATVDTDVTDILNTALSVSLVVEISDNYTLSDTLVLNKRNVLFSKNGSTLTTTVGDGFLHLSSRYITIRGMIFKNISGTGTFYSEEHAVGHDTIIEFCEFNGCQVGKIQHGTSGELSGGIGYNSTIRHNVVKNVASNNGMDLVDVSNITIENNEVYNCDGEGIKVGGGSTNFVKVNFNYCHDNGRDGIDLYNGGRYGECIGNRCIDNLQGIEIKYPTIAYSEGGSSADKFIVSNNVVTGSAIAFNAYANNIILDSNYCGGELICGGWNTIVSNNIIVSTSRGIGIKGLSNGRVSNNTIKMTGGSSANLPIYTKYGNSTSNNPQDVPNTDIIIENNTIDAGGYSYGINIEAMSVDNICKIRGNTILNVTSTGTLGGKDYVFGKNNNDFQDDVVIAATNNPLFNSSSTAYKTSCSSIIKNPRIDVIHNWKGFLSYNSASGTTYGRLTLNIGATEHTLVNNLWSGTINENVEFDIKIAVVDDTTLSVTHWNSFTGVYDHTEITGLTGLVANDLKFNIKGQTGTSDAAYRKYHTFTTLSSKNRYY